MEEEMVICTDCGKEVLKRITNRHGECIRCIAAERAGDMGVGDINTK
jgi:hypothetical protein